MSMTSPFMDSTDRKELWEMFGVDYRCEMLLNFGSNLLMSIGDRDSVAESLKEYDFIVSIDIFRTETSDFADIVLPDSGYLSCVDSRSNFPFIFSHPAGMGEWCWPIRQPVVEPVGEQRPFADILIEMADRAGFRADLNAAFNTYLDLQPPYRLKGDTPYTYEEMSDLELKDKFGEDKGMEWFKKEGVIKWPKKPEEVYWRHFVDVRVPIYWEWMTGLKEDINAITEPRGMKMQDEYYEPLPSFLPCVSHECEKEGFELYTFYYRDIIHTNSYTMENAWLDEAAQMDPFSYNMAINTATAKRMGLETGDEVEVEASTGHKVTGRLRLTEAIHPEGLGVAALCGHWGDGMPVAKGKGVFYNGLLALDWAHASPVNFNLDLCAKVKLTKIS
jgi:molybdopterin-containing oxidoreductase family molybdopterin binding subunit